MTSLSQDRVRIDAAAVAGLRDPHGVLSVYVDADPRQQATSRPAWVVEVENGLDDVRERVRAEGDRARWTAVLERLESLEAELAALLDPRAPGRGRALFATIDGGDVRHVSMQMQLRSQVALGEIADLTPLVVALDRGRPAGLVVVSLAAAHVFEQHLGLVEERVVVPLEPDTSDWRELKGPAAANPALAQHAAPQRDKFERRVDDHRLRLLEEASARIDELAAQRSWDRIVVAGDARLAQLVSAVLVRDERDVVIVDRTLHVLTSAAVGDTLAPELDAANERRANRIVERARDAALSGGAGALGLADVLSALNDGRASHLLFDDASEYRGARAPDGRLLPEGVVPPGTAPGELVREPSLLALMIERALAIDARVVPLSASSASALGEHDGIAALLRW